MQVDEYAEIGPRLESDNLYVNLKISHFSHQQKSRSFARHGQILGHWQTHWMLRQWHFQAFENLCQNTCSMCATGTHGGSEKNVSNWTTCVDWLWSHCVTILLTAELAKSTYLPIWLHHTYIYEQKFSQVYIHTGRPGLLLIHQKTQDLQNDHMSYWPPHP